MIARSAALALLLLAGAWSVGCGAKEARPLASRPDARGRVVARVGSEAITDLDVASMASGSGLDRHRTLARLIDEELLAQRALAELEGGNLIEDLAWRARIQALLRMEIEAPFSPARLHPGDVERALAERRPDLHHDGLVRVVHAVVTVPTASPPAVWDAALARARRLRDQVVAAHGERPGGHGFTAVASREGDGVRVETLAPFDRFGRATGGVAFVSPFGETCFGLSLERPLSEPVRTTFGVHVALLLERRPPSGIPVAQAEFIVRRDLATLRRNIALQALVDRLRVRRSAQLSESALATVRRVQRRTAP